MRSALALLAVVAGCSSGSNGAATSPGSSGGENGTRVPGAGVAPPDLANAMLPNPCGSEPARVDVRGGVASYESGLGEGFQGELELTSLGAYDLDGDGEQEHLAMVVCRPGGSGSFDGVWAFHAVGGALEVVGHLEGGDRADGGLSGARVENALVIVGRFSGEEEGLCCPTHVTDESYRLEGGQFVRISVGERRTVPSE